MYHCRCLGFIRNSKISWHTGQHCFTERLGQFGSECQFEIFSLMLLQTQLVMTPPAIHVGGLCGVPVTWLHPRPGGSMTPSHLGSDPDLWALSFCLTLFSLPRLHYLLSSLFLLLSFSNKQTLVLKCSSPLPKVSKFWIHCAIFFCFD